MSCPRDNTTLVRLSAEPPSVGICRSCHGMWIPHDVLEQYARQLKLIAANESFDEKLGDLAGAGAVPCPDGHGAMVTCHYQGVEIDVCPQCHGVWLDHGELAEIQRMKHPELEPGRNRGDTERSILEELDEQETISSFIDAVDERLSADLHDAGLGADLDAGADSLELLGEGAGAAAEVAVEAIAFVLEALFSSA